MIRGYCHTNLDEYKREEWPKEFVAVPRVGESVRSERMRELYVCKVVHFICHAFSGDEPQIAVELTGRYPLR